MESVGLSQLATCVDCDVGMPLSLFPHVLSASHLVLGKARMVSYQIDLFLYTRKGEGGWIERVKLSPTNPW